MSRPLYRIKSTMEVDLETGEPLYWSNLDGWVSKGSADLFTSSEMRWLARPSGSVWVEADTWD